MEDGRNITALTGLRGIAVLLVLIGHLQQRYFPYDSLAMMPFSGFTYFGITAFFVLSGFVIHWNYATLFSDRPTGEAWWTFFVARFSRLFPLHFMVIMLGLFSTGEVMRTIPHLFMMQSWGYNNGINVSYYNTWSISVEWLFYFVYAAAFPYLSRIIRSGSVWLLVGVVIVSFAAYGIAGPVKSETDMWLRYHGPYMRVFEFLTGVVAAQIVIARSSSIAKSDTAAALVLLATMIFHTRTAIGSMTSINYLIAPLVAVTVITASDRRSLLSDALSLGWICWIGERSYSIYLLEAVYLVHFSAPIERLLGFDPSGGSILISACQGVVMSLVAAITILAASDPCWRRFEMPARRYLKRRLVLAPRTINAP